MAPAEVHPLTTGEGTYLSAFDQKLHSLGELAMLGKEGSTLEDHLRGAGAAEVPHQTLQRVKLLCLEAQLQSTGYLAGLHCRRKGEEKGEGEGMVDTIARVCCDPHQPCGTG